MAVYRPGPIVADIRGSVGAETFARNQGGLYVRARTTPTDPNTADQQACRAAVTALSQYWSDTLTDQQRADWRTYAHVHPRPNRFGERTITNGYTRFMRINHTRYRVDTAVAFDIPPTEPPLSPPIFTFTADDSADTVTVALDFPNYHGGLKNLQMFAYGGPEVNVGRNFYNGPWRYLATNRYNTSWQFDPWTIAYPWNLTTGQKVFVRMVAQKSDHGELSESYQTSSVVIA